MGVGQARSRRSRRSEDGAIAVFIGLLAVVLFMAAALSVDIGLQINRKHQLIATLDAKIAHYRALETGAAQDADEPASDGGGNGLGTGHEPKPGRSPYDAG